ncbi:MAG TPA: hemerythrin family protein [Clostridiales bacterium]|mgnify:CR=1 FL=1|nr:hemerythrin family protein [Clostridiales bacterium]
MSIQWTEDLAVGVDMIDRQHQKLFEKINNLLDACSAGKGRAVVGDMIDFLGDYVEEHFSFEEQYMIKYNYPGYKAHRALHEEFKKNFSQLKDKLEEDGANTYIVILTNRVVIDWLNKHIGIVDKELGRYLKDKM